jgi:glutamate dehydrogenase (NAD(P)+)
VTGKPILLGGSQGRAEATARGCVFVIEEACKAHNIDLLNARVVVQGFGNAGATAALILHGMGCKVIGVSDSHGGIYNPNGLDIPAVFDHKKNTQSVVGFPGSEEVNNGQLLELDCDILIPAALEEQLTEENASKIKAKLIAEAANGPTTPEADRILYDRGIVVLPDILANAGGVTVSYFEWVQGMQSFYWTEEEVNSRLKRIMVDAFATVNATAQQYHVHMRTAALAGAIKRVADSTRVRGIYP